MGRAQDPRSMNRFLYAEGNPATLIDPEGHRIQATTEGGYVVPRPKPRPHQAVDPDSDGRFAPAPHVSAADDAHESASHASAGRAYDVEESGCSAAKLDCSYADINAMSMTDRRAWVREFQSSHNTEDWLHAIEGVVSAADLNGLTNASWFGTVDARILTNIQAGYVQFKGGASSDVGGVQEWAEVWQAVQAKRDPDAINNLVARAESASIVTGRAEARNLGKSPTVGETLALTASDTFRLAQRNRGIARHMATAACGFGCIAQSMLGLHPMDALVDAAVDERDFVVAYSGASAAFSQNLNPVWAGANFFHLGSVFDAVYP
jgi:hypothetical protein